MNSSVASRYVTYSSVVDGVPPTLEVVERQEEPNLVVVGSHEVLEVEEVRVGVEDIGEGALWLSCVVAPDALKG